MAFLFSLSIVLDLYFPIINAVSKQLVKSFADNKMSKMRFAKKPPIIPGLAAHLHILRISCQSVASYVLLILRALVVSVAPF